MISLDDQSRVTFGIARQNRYRTRDGHFSNTWNDNARNRFFARLASRVVIAEKKQPERLTYRVYVPTVVRLRRRRRRSIDKRVIYHSRRPNTRYNDAHSKLRSAIYYFDVFPAAAEIIRH